MIKVGTDIIEVERIKRAICHTPRFLNRVYSKREQEYLKSKKAGGFYNSAAARFAAKEAFLKAFELGLFEVPLNEISVENKPNGAPKIVLAGSAAKAAEGYEISVSLSHTNSCATATVIAAQLKNQG